MDEKAMLILGGMALIGAALYFWLREKKEEEEEILPEADFKEGSLKVEYH